jgi:hypothetical protein
MKLKELMDDVEYKIYCDLDGVLTDFDGQFKHYSGGISPDEFDKTRTPAEFWAVVGKGGEAFWISMRWMSEGKTLWNYIKNKNVSILSAPSRADSSKTGKRKWVDKNLSPKPNVILVNADSKRKYADANSILIDDKPENIQQWESAGGIAIHCKNGKVGPVIKKLQSMGI